MDPWGYFNAIVSCDERKGGARMCSGGDVLFWEFIYEQGMLNFGFKGPLFTWNRGALFQRLDQSLCNTDWMELCPDSSVALAHLQRLGFNHCPICLSTMLHNNPNMIMPFRFIASWMEHE